MVGKLRTYLGAIHIHTDKGGDASTLEDLVGAAREAGLDFIVITDQGDRPHFLESREGWQRGVLVIQGEEVRTPQGHFLAFETREAIGAPPDADSALGQLRHQYGTAVSIHHHLPPLRLAPGVPMAGPLPLRHADILEIWCFLDELLAAADSRELVKILKRPERLLKGPSRALFSDWDRELAVRMLPIIGGLNLHHRKHPLLEWKEIIPPKVAFQTICTCIQVGELPTVSIRARDLVWNALREGRAYVVNRAVGPEKGFEFTYQSPEGRIRLMGDDHAYVPGGRFGITLPEEGEIILRHNGQPLFWGTGTHVDFPATGPGAYRVEAWLNRRLWIISNPIRLVDEEGILQPTVSDVT